MAFTKREGYKKVKPEWRKRDHKPEGRLIGIEFEVEHPKGYMNILKALPEPKDPKNRPVTERDGSLHEENGLEIVFPPYKTAALKTGDTSKSYFARAIKAIEDSGVHITESCGMHMNVNTTGWSPHERTAYVYFFHIIARSWLERIGGRRLNHYCNQEDGMEWYDASEWTMHPTVAGHRANRIEVRFPASTTDLERIKNLTNFLELVEDFVKSPGIVDFMRKEDSYDVSDQIDDKFLHFLDNNTARPRTCATIKEILLHGYSS